MNEKEIITVVEAARILHISPQIVRAKCQKGLLPAKKIPGGRDWLLNRKEVEKILP
ncbi:helix-turn-helix domain-containing protein [Victivallis vadensis]|uniref:Helix-turn-helix domain-containing protein n=1 Tax=Victivallis vadensis TaxID=172901 RepID=A0A848AXJ2_9BACT|nr:helix-turn-helix domain-containing protein [Victivallis vadensis]NMD86260.1 helix-turn-helix domain-containing protein [Victivallis vadensis]